MLNEKLSFVFLVFWLFKILKKLGNPNVIHFSNYSQKHTLSIFFFFFFFKLEFYWCVCVRFYVFIVHNVCFFSLVFCYLNGYYHQILSSYFYEMAHYFQFLVAHCSNERTKTEKTTTFSSINFIKSTACRLSTIHILNLTSIATH